MSCKSIFVNLGGGGGGSVNTGVLQIAGGVALDSTLRFVEDQAGTDSILKLATNKASLNPGGSEFRFEDQNIYLKNASRVNLQFLNLVENDYVLSYNVASSFRFESTTTTGSVFYSGTITQNGSLTVKGLGGNIASFRDSSNVERAYFTSNGALISLSEVRTDYIQLNGTVGVYFNTKGSFAAPSDGVFKMTNNADTNFDRLQLGGTTSSFPSIKRSGINLEVRLADDTGYGGITAGRSTEKTLEVLEVSGAMGLGFFNTPAINQPTVAIGEATYVSNGGGAIHIDDTIGGYTLQQVVQALLNLGLLA
jgi:hypothetical protein